MKHSSFISKITWWFAFLFRSEHRWNYCPFLVSVFTSSGMPRLERRQEGTPGCWSVKLLKTGRKRFYLPSSSHVMSRWPWRLFLHKSSADACSQTRVQVPPTPAKSGNEGVCARPISGEGRASVAQGRRRKRQAPPPSIRPRHAGLPKWAAARMGPSKSQTIHSATRQRRHTAGDG